MTEILKFTIGVRSSARMFRVSSLSGIIIDKILSARGKGVIDEDYYKGIGKHDEKSTIVLRNDDRGHYLQLDHDNVTFTKDFYLNDTNFDWETFLKEFVYIWEIVNKELNITDIRRIGIVGEFKYKSNEDTPSKSIISKLTCLPHSAHPAKAKMRFEDRRATIEGIAPDVKKSDFLNVIHEIYDGHLDSEHPDDDFIFSTLDVQRYFSPLLNSSVPKEVEKIHKQFEAEKKKIIKFMSSNGIEVNV